MYSVKFSWENLELNNNGERECGERNSFSKPCRRLTLTWYLLKFPDHSRGGGGEGTIIISNRNVIKSLSSAEPVGFGTLKVLSTL